MQLALWSIFVERKEVAQRATYSAPLPVKDKHENLFRAMALDMAHYNRLSSHLERSRVEVCLFCYTSIGCLRVIEEWCLSWGMTPDSFSAFKSTPPDSDCGVDLHLDTTAMLAPTPSLILINFSPLGMRSYRMLYCHQEILGFRASDFEPLFVVASKHSTS